MTRVSANRRTKWLIIGGGSAALALGLFLVFAVLPRLLTSDDLETAGAVPVTTSQTPDGARTINATLYYVAPDGTELVPITREVLFATTPSEQARRIAEAQLQPPPDDYSSAIPSGATIRAVYLTPEGDAYVDVSADLATQHSGGTLGEALAVYALVNALVVNLPDVTAVQILINGQEVDSLAGHLDLRHPLPQSLEWVRRGQ